MRDNINVSKKDILTDPLAAFSRLHADADDQEITALKTLWQQYCAVNKNIKDIRNRTKGLSRQIGEAKRNGSPVDLLMAKMQELSAQLRLLSSESSSAEKGITGFFKSGVTHGSPEEQDKSSPVSEKRIYRLTDQNIDEVSIVLVKDEHTDWNAYLERNPAASIYHRTEWRELINNTFGHAGYYFMARNREQDTVGVLPLIHMKSRLFGNFLVSMPYFNYGGAIADHPSIEQRLMETASEQAASLRASHVEYRDDIPRNGMPVRTEKVNMVLPLPPDPATFMESFSAKLRSQIRRAQREKPVFNRGGSEYLNDFYKVFSHNMRDLGTPVYSKSFFRNILQCFPDNSCIVVARLANKPVAAAFLLGHRDTLEIPWASTLRKVNPLSINTFLYWEILKHAIESGYRNFDFGRSSRDSGTFRFKRQWGAKPRQLYWHYWLSDGGKPPSINPGNPRYALMINTWKHLPVPICNLLGPPIVRNIP